MTMLRRTITAIVMISAVIVVLGILVVFGARPTNTSLTSASAADMPQQITTANNAADSSDTANQSGGRSNNASMIFIDPKTGEFTATPPEDYGLQQDQELQKAVSTSHKNLISRPAPGGGIAVYFGDGLQNLTMATIDSNGQVKIECITEAPESLEVAGESTNTKGTEE